MKKLTLLAAAMVLVSGSVLALGGELRVSVAALAQGAQAQVTGKTVTVRDAQGRVLVAEFDATACQVGPDGVTNLTFEAGAAGGTDVLRCS